MTPKKYALTCGINNTNGEIILSTDGDCIVPKGWSFSMVNSFKENTGIVVGRSTINLSISSRVGIELAVPIFVVDIPANVLA